MIFSDRGRKKTNFFNGKDPMSYSPDGKYIKHFEVPSPTAFKPYDGQKQYSLEKNNPQGLFFDQDMKGKEHNKMKQEYYDYCQYMMSLGKQPKSQQQYHNDIMNLAARPSTRDLKQAKQKLYAQELQRQIDDKNKQRFSSQPNRSPGGQSLAGFNDSEMQGLADFKNNMEIFVTPAKQTYGGSGDPIYDEYGQINANIRGISDKLHQGSSISYSPMRNNNKNVKGSRTTLGEGYFQETKISNIKSQLKKQQQLQHQMEQEGKSIMDKMFERQEERQMNRMQRNNEYIRDIERQMQQDQNIFHNPLAQQDKFLKMGNDYHASINSAIAQQPQKSIFQEMSDDNQKRKAKRDIQMEQYNNELQEQIELKKQSKKIQNEIDKIKEQKEEEKIQKEREELRKQMEEESKRRKKILQDTDQENQKIIEQQKKLQKNQERLQEKQNHLMTEALEMQNKLKHKANVEARRSSQPTLDVPKSLIQIQYPSDTSSQKNQGMFSSTFQQNPLPSVVKDQFGVSTSIFPINSQPFNLMKQKPSQYPPISVVNPVQKLYDKHEAKSKEDENQISDEILKLRRELQSQTYKIQEDLSQIRNHLKSQQSLQEHQSQNQVASQENLIVKQLAQISDQVKSSQEDIINKQTDQIKDVIKSLSNSLEEKERKKTEEYLKQQQDEMIKQLQEQQKQLLEEHKIKLKEEKQQREIDAQRHANQKAIQDINVELQKNNIKEEMRFKILKNKIKEIDKTQTNSLLLKTALASLQQTPRSSTMKGDDQDKQKYKNDDHENTNNPIIQQHFYHNTNNQNQGYNTERQQSSPNQMSHSQNNGFSTERKGNDQKKQGLLSQYFHYDNFSTPRRPLSSNQRKKRIQQNSMISSAIQTNMIEYKDSEFQVDQKEFIKDMKPFQQDCRKKGQCSRNQKRADSSNQFNNQSPQITLPIVKRRDSITNAIDPESSGKRKQYLDDKRMNATFHKQHNNASSYIDSWNSTAINQANYVNPYSNTNNMNEYLNNSIIQSPNPNLNHKLNHKKYPHSLYQSTYQPKSKLRSSSLLTDRDDQFNENSPNILEKNILDAIVKASNHNRTKSSQKRSVSRYHALTQKELQKEQETLQNLYSPSEDVYDLGVDYSYNASPFSIAQQTPSNQHNNNSYIRNSPSSRYQKQSPSNLNHSPAERVIHQLDGILSDIKSGNLPQRKEIV